VEKTIALLFKEGVNRLREKVDAAFLMQCFVEESYRDQFGGCCRAKMVINEKTKIG